MIALDSGDKIRGDASAVTVVDYTLHGLDNNAIKQLADGQLPSAIGDLYTADSADVVATITLVNTDSSARTVNLYLTPNGGTARRLIPKDMSLGIGFSLHFDGKSIVVVNASGQVTQTVTAHTLGGSEHEADTLSNLNSKISDATLGEKIIYIKVLANDADLATGDGKAYITIPDALNGMNLVDADIAVYTASSSGLPTVQLNNLDYSGGAQDMLSTRMTIDANELNSYDAVASPVINGSYDDVATGDRIRIDVDVAGTGTKGLDVILTFQVP